MSGLLADSALLDRWNIAVGGEEGASDVILIQIVDEKIVLIAEKTEREEGGARLEAARLLIPPKQACFVLVRLDASGWLFVFCLPDRLGVRDRMVYASTREGLKRQLGSNHFTKGSLDVHSADEVSEEVYNAQMEHHQAPAPMTEEEVGRRSVNVSSHGFESSRAAVMPMAYGMSEEAKETIRALGSGAEDEGKLLHMRIENEKIVSHGKVKDVNEDTILDRINEVSVDDLPMFHLYVPATPATAVLILNCPDHAPVKEKMIFSSALTSLPPICKGFGIEVRKYATVHDREDILIDLFLSSPPAVEKDEDEAAPPVVEQKFSKPKSRRRK